MKTLPLIKKLDAFTRKLPKWSKAVIGILMLLVGLAIITKPFNSIGLMVALIGIALILDGLAKFAKTDTTKAETANRYLGLLIAVAGLVVLVVPSLSIQLIAVIVGVSLLVGGVTELLGGLQGTRERRITSVVKGLALGIFGVLALAWQDVAILIIAVAFSIKLIFMGIGYTVGLLQSRKADKQPRFVLVRRIGALAGAFLLLGLSLLLLGVSHTFRASVPIPDAFYSYNQQLPSEPGKLLKSEPYAQSMPNGVRGWRILYTTTKDDSNKTVLASAFVMVPKAVSSEPQPVVAWTHGTTGFVSGCAPTVQPAPFPLDKTVPAVQEVVANGWVMVGTDYAGMGTKGVQPYLIGQGEGRSALDSVRAAKQIKGLELANQTIVWGHSQGGGAALWTGQLASTYAPDVHVVGVMAAAPATDLPALLDASKSNTVGKIMGTFALRAYSETYPDVKWSKYVSPKYDLIARNLSNRCLAEKSTLVSILQSLIIPGSIYKTDPTTGALGERLKQNIPTGKIDVPVLITQGEADPLVLPKVQADYVASQCKTGEQIEYKTYASKDHVGLVDNDAAFNKDLVQWTQDRFSGSPAKNTC